jgi:uncharacterized protein with HEPN domain
MLSELITLATNTDAVLTGNEYNPDAIELSKSTEYGDDAHGLTLGEMTTVYSKLVQKHLDFAKNIVKPAISQVAEKIGVIYADLIKESKIEIEIKVDDLPEPLLDYSLVEMLAKYKGNAYIPFKSYIPFNKELSAPEVLEYCKSADSTLDSAFAIFAAKVGDSVLVNTADMIFSSEQIGKLQAAFDDTASGTNYALVAYLLSNKLYDNPPEGITLSLEKYNEIMNDIRYAAAFRLCRAIQMAQDNIDSKILITNYDKFSVTVVGPTYRKWKEEGGNDAAILGNVMMPSPKVYLGDIIENQSRCIEYWESQNRFLNMSIQSKAYSKKKEAIRNSVLSVASDNFNEYFDHLVPEGVTATVDMVEYVEFTRLLDLFIDGLRETDMINVWSVSTKAVGNCLFYYTDATKILEGVDGAIQLNPNINIREALLLSTIEYVADSICSQIKPI